MGALPRWITLWLIGLAALGYAQPFRVTDATGRSVEIRSTERIVSLGGVNTEILFALGVGDRIVGRDGTSEYPKEVMSRPSVGLPGQYSAEAILALRPTLVVAREDTRPAQVLDQVRGAGVPVVVVSIEPTVEGAKRRIRLLAQAVGRQETGEALVRSLERELLALKSYQAQQAPKGKVRGLVVYLPAPQVAFICGEGSIFVAVMELAGVENALKGVRGCQPMNPEAVVAARPDLLVTTKKTLETVGSLEGLLRLPGLAQTPAGQRRRVVVMEENYLGNIGPRMGRAALDLFRAAYLREGYVEIVQ
ncbi:MAG: ABC transporter substrate-binding protein [Thermus sp.]